MAEEGEHPEDRVGWFELFYDLVVVAAISQVGKVYLHDPSALKTALIAAAIAVLFAVWLLNTISFGLFRGDSLWRRLLLLVQMLFAFVGALALGREGPPDGTGFAAIAVVFITQALIYGRHLRTAGALRASIRLVVVSLLAAALAFMVIAGILRYQDSVQAKAFVPFLLALGVLAVVAPVLVRVLPQVMPSLDAHHLGERMGLLIIIVLGESFINLVGAVGSKGGVANGVAFVVMLAVIYCLWSIYFTGIRGYRVPASDRALRGWVVAHALLVFAIVAVAVEFTDLVRSDSDVHVAGSGHWTPLPLLGAVAALWWVARLSPDVPAVIERVQALAGLVILGLTVVDVAQGPDRVSHWVLVSSGVVIADALACTVVTQRQRRQVTA